MMGLSHLKHAEFAEHLQTCKGRVVLRGDGAKDDAGGCAVFTEGASASHDTAAKVLWMPGMSEVADGAVSAYTQVKLSDAARLLKLLAQQFGSGFLKIVARNVGITLTTQCPNQNATNVGHPLAGLLWERRL